jgi:hypothetical protein
MNLFTLSHDFVTCRGSPEVTSTAFDAQPPDLPPVRLMDMGFAIIGSLGRHRRPSIRFLFIGSRLCSTLLSGPASRRVTSPLRFAVTSRPSGCKKGTCASELSTLLGTRKKIPASSKAGILLSTETSR